MFLNRLLDRATNAPSVLRPAPHMATVLGDPAWGDPEQQSGGLDEPFDVAPDAATRTGHPTSGKMRQQGHEPTKPMPSDPPVMRTEQSKLTPERRAPVGATTASAQSPFQTPDIDAVESPSLPDASPEQQNQAAAAHAKQTPDTGAMQVEPLASAKGSQTTTPDQNAPSATAINVASRKPESDAQIERLLDAHAQKGQADAAEQSIEVVVEIGNINLVTPPRTDAVAPAMPLSRPRPGPRVSISDYLSERRGKR